METALANKNLFNAIENGNLVDFIDLIEKGCDIYMYDHGCITINCDGFACPWDSGQVGYIYVSRQKLKDEYGVKRISSVMLERAEKALRREVNVMDQYITGDVYGFQVIKRYLDNNNDVTEEST
jgi:hypothetical protein